MSGPDMRVTIASAVANGVRRYMSDAVTIDQTETTSGCPVVVLTLSSGQAYNLTITRAKKAQELGRGGRAAP